MKINWLVSWMAWGAAAICLSIAGLHLADKFCGDGLAGQLVFTGATMVGWLGFVTLLVSFLSWLANNIFPVDRD